MHDLDPVAILQFHPRPVGASHHLAIDFDGEALGYERELFDECIKRRPLLYIAWLSVKSDLQAFTPPY